MAQQVHEIMAADPVAISAQATMADAARLMRDQHVGDVMITADGHLRGMVTDRDLAVRGLAEERPGSTPVGEVCSPDLVFCRPRDEVDRAVALMREHAVRRLPVVDGDRLVGVVSLGDLALERDPHSALADISTADANS
ncbi:CBS domain-containing protein [Actinospica sp.]|jgi:CBS domain-containing protein|uniref:CBS domain-containing protein n=1 Tax=Actinospica sp. TaxID=1872142 RepID=UPI002B643B39|nr:CBS domain-containing protein [Actinospica sp.]HWG26165.1 CBS domain-containing protein [Actinospica sp.]